MFLILEGVQAHEQTDCMCLQGQVSGVQLLQLTENLIEKSPACGTHGASCTLAALVADQLCDPGSHLPSSSRVPKCEETGRIP